MLRQKPEQEPIPTDPADFLKYLQGEKDFVPPAEKWYTGKYLWDICFASIVYADSGYPEYAEQCLFSLLDGQRPNGMIPNYQPNPYSRNRFNLEKFTFNDPTEGSDYTQPYVLGLAAMRTYEAYVNDGKLDEANKFVIAIYPKLVAATDFVRDQRTDDQNDLLAKIVHPCESGRDSDPNFDQIKRRLPKNGHPASRFADRINPLLDYVGVMALSIRNKRDGWALEKIKARFWYADPMFASIFADHLAHMSDLAKIAGNHSDQMDYELLAKVASEQIQSQLWQPGVMTDPGIFRVLDTSGKPVPETTITSISPVILRDLAGGKLADIVRLYRSKFDTKFPIPSVAITSPNYDPGYQEKLIMWRGPTWIWMNYLVARGLFYHYNRTDIEPALAKECQDIATKIFVTSRLLTKNGYHEHYNPETGEPQRTRNFAGSALGQLSLSSFTQ